MKATHLLQVTSAVAILAATPAVAERPEAGMTGPAGAPNPEATQRAPVTGTKAPANDGANNTSMVIPTAKQTAAVTQYSHRPATSHETASMHPRDNTSRNAEVDRLNDESYHAAQQGQTFTVGAVDKGTPAAGGSR